MRADPLFVDLQITLLPSPATNINALQRYMSAGDDANPSSTLK